MRSSLPTAIPWIAAKPRATVCVDGRLSGTIVQKEPGEAGHDGDGITFSVQCGSRASGAARIAKLLIESTRWGLRMVAMPA